MKLDLNKIIELNQQGFSQKEITKIFNRNNYQDIQSFLRRHNVKLVWKKKKKYPIDESFFETIDSEIKAYLLGFFYADGCIFSDYRFGLCIQRDDEYIINLFRDFISPGSYIKQLHNTKGAKNRKPQVVWRVQSSKIVSNLYRLGLTQRKTLNSKIILPVIPDNLLHHFIRGFFDGDGSVGKKTIRGKYEGNRVCFSGTWLNLFNQLKDILHKQGIKNIRIDSKQGITCIYYALCIDSFRDSDIFFDYVYKDANFFLERKYKKFYKHNTEVTAKTKELAAP